METIKNLSSIYSFIKVAEHQSFSKAAIELGVSKSLLSKTIQELERKLDRSLFKRNTRQVHFTETGKEYYNHYHKKIEELKVFEKLYTLNEFGDAEPIKISVAGAYGEDRVSKALAKLLLSYPRVKAELSFSTNLVDIYSEEYDLAVRVSRQKPQKGYAYKVAFRKEFVCASPGYLEAFGEPKAPKDLKAHNCLLGQQETWHFKTKGKVSKLRIGGNFKSPNGRAICNAAIEGLGICKLPESYVESHIAKGELRVLLTDYTEKEVPIWAVTGNKLSHSPVLKHLVELIKESV